MNQIWCKAVRPTTNSVLWLEIPKQVCDHCAEVDDLAAAIDYIGNETSWQFLPQKFFVINSELQLETLMESEV